MWVRKTSLLISVRETPITAKGSGRTRLWNKDQSAGTSFRLVRSPEAPKITITQDSSATVIPSASPRAPARLRQGLEIAQGLRRLQSPESVPGVRDDDLLRIVPGELEKDAVRLPALVELAGGVQVARAVRHRGGRPQPVAQEDADLLQALPRVPGG